jgi:hypothetical protein
MLLGDRLRDVEEIGADGALRQEDDALRILPVRRGEEGRADDLGRRSRGQFGYVSPVRAEAPQLIRLVRDDRAFRVAVAEVERADRAVLELHHPDAEIARGADDVLVEVRDDDVHGLYPMASQQAAVERSQALVLRDLTSQERVDRDLDTGQFPEGVADSAVVHAALVDRAGGGSEEVQVLAAGQRGPVDARVQDQC